MICSSGNESRGIISDHTIYNGASHELTMWSLDVMCPIRPLNANVGFGQLQFKLVIASLRQ